jgi:hypothetical protein
MTGSQRTPPRFVPTLTTVLEPLPEPVPAEAPPQQHPVPVPAPMAAEASAAIALDPQAQLSEAEAFRLEEQLMHRVLQRIDLSLEEQLSDVVSAAVQQQLDVLIPRLRDEIETVLRTLVSEALARELSDNTGSTPALRAQNSG